MRKILCAAVLLASLSLFFTAPLFAAVTWDELVAGLEKREMVRSEGWALLLELKEEAPGGSEQDLWKMLWVGEPRSRAVAGVALMDRIFPGGSPARWEDASGFLSGASYKPRQLAAMDAFFVTVAALDTIPDGEWTAALLLSDFARSARGLVYFIEQMPQGLKEPIDSIVSKTGIGGDWSVKAMRRPLPLLPSFGGSISRDTAESRQLQYLDGSGSIAGNGCYAWDRDRGYLYQVVERSDRFWRHGGSIRFPLGFN